MLLSITILVFYAECRIFIVILSAECLNFYFHAECHNTECHYTECRPVYYAECRYAESRHAECRGANLTPSPPKRLNEA